MKQKRKMAQMPIEFDGWIKSIQKKLYAETNEIFSKTQIMRMLAKNSKVNVKRKEDKYEIGFGI